MDKLKAHAPQAAAIRQRMKEVRCDLDEDVQDIVEGARDMREWRSYVRDYPWVCLGVAAAAGYLIIPRQRQGTRPEVQTLAASSDPTRLPAPSHLGNAQGILLGFLGTLVMRGVSAYIGEQAGKFFATPIADSQQDINHEEPHS